MNEWIHLDANAPEEVEIQELTAELYPDQRRVKVLFRLSPSQIKPTAVVSLERANQPLVSVNLIEVFSPVNEITLHMPAHQDQPGEYTVKLELFKVAEGPSPEDPKKLTFTQTSLKSITTQFRLP